MRAKAALGEKYVLTDPDALSPYAQDWRGRYRGDARAVVLPNSTEEVATLLRLCQEFGIPVVPQAGNTGLTGGAVPLGAGEAIILNVSRLNRIREVDLANNSLTAEAGAILANVRGVAEEHDRLFPMLLGSVGSCEVGGLVSTNAGGTGVLRYGNMRELVLGLEVVLPDGRIWNGLRALRKDNAGYDLKQLFIGAEGTLGIVTAAVLKLFPRPTAGATAMVALVSVTDVIELLQLMQKTLGNRIEAFEVMSRSQLDIVVKHGHGLSSPIPIEHPWYVMIEIADNAQGWDAGAQLEGALAAALEQELITDAVVATDIAKAERIWALRHNISEANKNRGFTVSNDTSVPISRVPEFVARVDQRLAATVSACDVCYVGHVGDGNIHVVLVFSRETYRTPEECEAVAAVANEIVHEESVRAGGSISAEHGIGLMHVDRLRKYKAPLDLEMMARIKAAFDPENLMNPAKIIRR
ncbi:FAD-binding oxidoreductase [Xanthobacter versatilis]|uniref:FAD-binding oxidoreductase n=1 Tax=Xanthobacter autotrophicus (strain ATCC BAA-1158 / Py2) TaxID=78245 RepID=UPI0037292EC3